MNQNELNRAVARATGESVETIKRLGFLLSEPDEEFVDADAEELGPQVLDWDAVEQARWAETRPDMEDLPDCKENAPEPAALSLSE